MTAHSSPGSSSETGKRDELIANLAALIAGLAVPISMPRGPVGEAILGQVTTPWSDIHSQLIGFGWAMKQDYEERLREVLYGRPEKRAEPGSEVQGEAAREGQRTGAAVERAAAAADAAQPGQEG